MIVVRAAHTAFDLLTFLLLLASSPRTKPRSRRPGSCLAADELTVVFVLRTRARRHASRPSPCWPSARWR